MNYSAIQTMAHGILKDAGLPGTLAYYTQGAYDNATQTRARVQHTLDVYVVALEYRDRRNTGVEAKDQRQLRIKRMLVSPIDTSGVVLPIDPEPAGWTLTDNAGAVWSITNVKVVRPNSQTALMYELACYVG